MWFWPENCAPSLWGKVMIPMYMLWLHDLYGLHGTRCPRNLITHSRFGFTVALLLHNQVHIPHCFNIMTNQLPNKPKDINRTIMIQLGVCITYTATRHCRYPFSQWQHSFRWKLRSHWLKVLQQRHIAYIYAYVYMRHEGFQSTKLRNYPLDVAYIPIKSKSHYNFVIASVSPYRSYPQAAFVEATVVPCHAFGTHLKIRRWNLCDSNEIWIKRLPFCTEVLQSKLSNGSSGLAQVII